MWADRWPLDPQLTFHSAAISAPLGLSLISDGQEYDVLSFLHIGFMPLALITGSAAGEARNLISALPASGCAPFVSTDHAPERIGAPCGGLAQERLVGGS